MPTSPMHDPKSVAGKDLPIEEHTQLLVVGAGPAGLAAAIEAAGRGLAVMLVDENPVSFQTMGEEVPLHFGQGMSPLVRNHNAMLEAFVGSEPAIEAAFEAGVDVRLGTAIWGLYANGPGVGWLPGSVAGLVGEGRSWLVGFERAIVATGRRDMGLAFPGWEKPRVIGAAAAALLAGRYAALEARRVVVLGTSAEALATAVTLRSMGIEVAAIIEAAQEPIGPAELLAEFAEAGTEILTGHVVREAEGRDGVEAVLVAAVDAGHRPSGDERRIPCDAVILGVGATPVIDLLDALGCRIAFQPERGGYAPKLDAMQRSSLSHIYAAGDCAGVWPRKTFDRSIAESEGRRAAIHATSSLLGAEPVLDEPLSEPDRPAYDISAYRLGWVQASVIEARGEPCVCQCEEVTAREILEVRPPRYLDWTGEKRNDRSLAALLGEGPPNPDQVKRLTRAGMGPCQGRRCREQVAALLALEGAVPLSAVPLAGYRAPVRPLPLSLFAALPEAEATAEHWDSWFGMPGQWRPFWEVEPLYTVASSDHSGPVASE